MNYVMLPSDGYIVIYGFWISLICIGLLTTLLKCFSKRFQSVTAYAKHCRFWFKTTALLSFINAGMMLYSPDYSHFSGLCSFSHVCLIPWLIFAIALLLVTLLPATIQRP